ncbi:MAG TPA: hypothetical protein ENF44_03705, partial [Deltaproteobacteria bacterium]|nr:hypothetical protein [Deltaproteobacteria bacterium]
MEREKVSQILEDLAFRVMTVDPGDLPALGEVLKGLEELPGLLEGEAKELASALKTALERVLLEELDGQRGLDFVARGVKALQRLVRGEAIPGDILEEARTLGVLPRGEGSSPSAQEAEEGHEEVKEEEVALGDDPELYQSFITEARDHLASVEVNVVELETRPDDAEVINAIFRPFHTIKGVAGFLNLTAINRLAHALEDMLDAARSGRLTITSAVIDLILEGVDALKSMIDDLERVVAGEKRALETPGVEDLIARVREMVESGGRKLLGETLVEKGVVKEQDVEEALEVQKEHPEKKVGEILIESGKARAKDVVHALREQRPVEATIKIEAHKLDNLMDMVGELVIAQSMIRQNPVLQSLPDPKLQQDIGQLARITAELQKTAMALRMVPIRQTFQKMIRLVRDLSKKSGKKVRLLMEGEDTEIDRNMVEEI